MRIKKFIIIIFFIITTVLYAQNSPKKEIDMDAFVQDLFAQQSANTNYEAMYESLFQFYRYPLDLNKATRDELESLFILSPMQAKNIIEYRNKNGKFLTIFELQAVEALNKSTFEKLVPFVKVIDEGLSKDAQSLWQRIKSEENSYAILRYEQTLENRKGFLPYTPENQRFIGTPAELFARYRIQSQGDFSLGITAKNDAGEAIAWNPSKKQYFLDYYSAHFFLQNKGALKALAIGDYQVQIGQGLVMSSGFYIGKGAEPITTVKRSNQGIRPYTGAMEAGFLRGIAATLNFKKFDWVNFFSYRNLDGNIRESFDTLSNSDEYVSSVLHFGYHRTQNELANKGNIGEAIGGTHLLYLSSNKNLKLGSSGVFTNYNNTFQSQQNVYNLYDFSGSQNYNIGADFSYNLQNFTFFGEINKSKGGGTGIITGLIASLHPKIDLSMLFRRYDPNFYSFYGNTFGEISTNRNEQGFYWGIKYTPHRKLNFAAYFDKFSQPWLTIRADALTEGYEYRLRINWLPTKKISLSAQYINEYKQTNKINNLTIQDYIVGQNRSNWLFNMDYKTEKFLTLKSRVQITTFEQEDSKLETGIVLLQDVNFDFNKKFRIGFRFAVFDSKNFNTRLYVYEKKRALCFCYATLSGYWRSQLCYNAI